MIFPETLLRPLFQNDENATAGDDDGRVPERSEIAPEQKWNVESMYADAAQWEADFARIEELVAPLEAMRGKLDSAEALARLFERETELERLADRLYTYAHLRADEDTADDENQARQARAIAKLTEISARLAWVTPEILSHSEDELRAWTDSEAMRENRYAMVKLLRRKPHTLSDKEETLLSRAGEVFIAPRNAFNFLTNADMRFPEVEDANGSMRELTQERYTVFLHRRDRRVRREAFEAMYDTYGGFKNTLASTLSSTVKLHNFMARTRNFDSALEASLHDDNIPVSVYDGLIAATRKELPAFYEYVALRRRRLGLDDLDMCDMYVPIVPEYELEVPFEQARDWVVEALAPLGDEYGEALRTAFTDRWIDVYENRGKRSGAYSGGCYDSLPFVLLNYQGRLEDVFTLAHELGHSMHTWLSNKNQPHRFAQYPIFIAEIASTLNEALLLRHLLSTTDDPRFKAYLLNHRCDAFKGTVYRQTMFAEFEKAVHEMDARGEPLTPNALCDRYYLMNKEYYGPEIDADLRIALEWSRIPHFYYNFYVYKYATSFCASQIFSERVVEDETGRGQYLDLLRSGGSADPIDLVKRAGIDMTAPKTVEGAFDVFAETVKELDKALKALR